MNRIFRKKNNLRLRKIHLENAYNKAKNDLELLSMVTNAIMQSLETEQILYTFLTALTSNEGLGFNRALYFEINEKDQTLEGKMGLGPYTLKEADEIWRFIEGNSMNLRDLFDSYDKFKNSASSELNIKTRSISIPLKEEEGILALTALEGMPFDVRTSPAKLTINEHIKDKLGLDNFVTVPLKTKNRVIGVILVDKIFSSSPISPDTIRILNIFADHAAVAIENSFLYKKTEYLSRTDALTGLWNTRHFNSILDEKLSSCLKNNTPLTLMMIDMDNFKQFNDTLGHVSGDNAIKDFANILRSLSRDNDFACRYGGEEFSIVMTDTKMEQALKIAERIRLAAEDHYRKYALMPDGSNLTISIGLSEFSADEKDKTQLFRKADLALYLAKRTGKNKVCVYSPEMKQTM